MTAVAPRAVIARLRAAKGPFNPDAKLDPSQVEDLRVPYVPYDVFPDDAAPHAPYWGPSAFPGGISPYPNRVLVRPGPMGDTYFPPGSPANKPLPGEDRGGEAKPKRKPQETGGGHRSGLKTYRSQIK